MKKWIFLAMRILGTVLGFFNLLMFFAMRPCWSGISSTLGYKGGANEFLYILPVLICVLFLITLLADLILKAIFKKDWLQIVFLAIHIVFLGAIIYIIANGAIDYMRFIWPKFFVGLGVVAVLVILFDLIFIYPKTFLKDNLLFKYGLLGLASVLSIALLLNFSINWINYKPVVYAVEDRYQIVFSTNSEATAWAEIGGKNYYDTYAGSTKKYGKIHKIEVPMAALDEAKHYTVHSQHVIYAGPFGGFLGRDVSESVDFKPVDTSDGIQYLSFSDVHMNDLRAAETASFIEKYDFLVLAGDIISDIETVDDANFTSLTAYEITKGQIPVVYARGNHDVKGRYAEELHKYVGANGEKFYYNFYFQDVYGIVLDIGEDHDDDWWEYYGTAHYEDYQAEQIEWLKSEIDKRDFDHYAYHLAISHIPLT
ncbi:MAG: metallophosphoesterase, partial [Bacilli bacterium]|nr:metallophosphoesterase [Bacilli bacterium]